MAHFLENTHEASQTPQARQDTPAIKLTPFPGTPSALPTVSHRLARHLKPSAALPIVGASSATLSQASGDPASAGAALKPLTSLWSGHEVTLRGWGNYPTYEPVVGVPLNTVTRKEARAEFEHVLATKSQRISVLADLLDHNSVTLDSSDAGIQEVNDWYRENVEPNPEVGGRLTTSGYSVSHDIGLFLGDTIIDRVPELHWILHPFGKKELSYQRAVIGGFSRMPVANYTVDPRLIVAVYGHRVVASRGSIATLGKVPLRGVEIDLDAQAADSRRRKPVEEDAFWRLISAAVLKGKTGV